MMMFLSLLAIGLIAVVVMSAVVLGASPREVARPEFRPEAKLAAGAPRFFGGDLAGPPVHPQMPVDAVIAQLERHVRIEKAAAEALLDMTSSEKYAARAESRLPN